MNCVLIFECEGYHLSHIADKLIFLTCTSQAYIRNKIRKLKKKIESCVSIIHLEVLSGSDN